MNPLGFINESPSRAGCEAPYTLAMSLRSSSLGLCVLWDTLLTSHLAPLPQSVLQEWSPRSHLGWAAPTEILIFFFLLFPPLRIPFTLERKLHHSPWSVLESLMRFGCTSPWG